MTATQSQYTGTYELDFERPLVNLEKKIAELEAHAGEAGADITTEIRTLRRKHTDMLKKAYANLSAWNTVRVARHPGRPQSVDYIRACVKDFCELHGDRNYGDDPAILTGFGRIGSHKCMIIAHNKGKDTHQRILTNFGMAHPEGYRKALAKLKLAEKYNLPGVMLIDTPGAYPGIGAEERGQAEAIAVNLRELSRLRVPLVSVVIGEGASGGALGIGIADRVAMLQYAWYSVISPEGCSSILWKSSDQAERAAEALRLTAQENLRLGVIDAVIEEPMGAAHRNPDVAAENVGKWIAQTLRELKRFKIQNLVQRRADKLRKLGEFSE